MPLIPGSRRAGSLFCVLLVLSPLGCSGGSKPKTVAITGKVVYANGKPLTAGSIIFNPAEEGANAPLTAIKPDGTFEFPSENGVPPGDYRVSLATPEGEGEAAPSEGEGEGAERKAPAFPVPPKYLQGDTSGWTVTVKESGNEPLTFTIK